MTGDTAKKSETARREEEVLSYWKEKHIFEKSLEKRAPKGEFVFYDGPPFATGLPHTGSLLSSVIKDVIPRYKTMRGYFVRRRWGWDCHGLPIESLIEKRLGLKTKKDIERVGVDVFNEAARASVLEFADEWEKYVERVGRWVDFKNSYKTMDNTYIESVWWALKQLHEKGLLYEGRRVLLYCTHCETPLAKAEIAMDNTYKDVTEEAVTVKFKVKDPASRGLPEHTYILAWTTTPWTLPGNVALAVGADIEYTLTEVEVPGKKEYFLTAKNEKLIERVFGNLKSDDVQVTKKSIRGAELAGLTYEPLYHVSDIEKSRVAHTVYTAPFVSVEDGTGVVHTAVMYGEDDYALGQKESLPMVQLLDASGCYIDRAPQFVRGKYLKDAEKDIKHDLELRGLLFSKKNHTHSYPHCYRCGTPLIFNAVESWFINIQKVKRRMLAENEKVTWVPEHLKHGRFQNIVESAPDWTISRNRFWASPLPIWKEVGGGRLMVVGSVAELKEKAKRSGNRYFILRHGEADTNAQGFISSDRNAAVNLTEKGIQDVRISAGKFAGVRIDHVYTSPFGRTIKTAEIAADTLGIPKERISADERLCEVAFGAREGISFAEFLKEFPERVDRFERAPEGGENFSQVRKRMGDFLYEMERTHKGKNILIVSHGTPLWMLMAAARGESKAEAIETYEREYPAPGTMHELPFAPLPVNGDYELDLHRPYTDGIVLVDESGREYRRVSEVVDCWVESSSMPFAEYHYPFENKAEFEKRFPGDFIAEYIAQTRTWFYYMHAMGALLFDSLAFRTVISTGTILAADGSKMSKSKGNYTDPLDLLDTFGADALRFHLLSSVVMQAEDLNFRDEDVQEAHNRVVGILWNTFKFYELYKNDLEGGAHAAKSPHILDRWILERLNVLIRDVTDALERYNTPRVCRLIREFIEDYSTWYVRRSRDRMKESGEDKQFALATQRHVLTELSKVIAPIMPFLAEKIYAGTSGARASVHLEEWPTPSVRGFFSFLRPSVLSSMEMTRAIVSRALESRAAAKVRVRQPLSRLSVAAKDFPTRDRASLLSLVADEVNVEKVDVSEAIPQGEVELDTKITPELEARGLAREAIRAIQAARRAQSLSPGELRSAEIRVRMREAADTLRDFDAEIRSSASLTSVAYRVDENVGPLGFDVRLK